MTAYIQRLVERAGGAFDKQPRMTPFIRHWTKEMPRENEHPFESANQFETSNTAARSPTFNENKASSEEHCVQQEVPNQNTNSPVDASTILAQSVSVPRQLNYIQGEEEVPTTMPKIRKDIESGVQLGSVFRQQTEDDTISIRPEKANQYDAQSPLSKKDTRAQNLVLPLHQAMPESNVAEKPEIAPSQAQEKRLSPSIKAPLNPPRISIETMIQAEDKRMADIRPRNIMAPASPLTSQKREQPSLVIGRLQVDVVSPQPEAPLPPQVSVAAASEHPQQKRNARHNSKLRFGLGQL